ncbi:MAG: hypothetical protein IPL55_17775 [Saprospiraceae bacterium]|nr:hypothetical protein [Saprospiraceae bacterium]
MKTCIRTVSLLVILFVIFGCRNQLKNSAPEIKDVESGSKFTEIANQLLQNEIENPFSISLSPTKTNFYIPALQSFAETSYNDLWIIIGGEVAGFHGTSNNPPPFSASVANDSMWVIDLKNEKSYGIPVPAQYRNALAVTNPQFYRVGNSFYLCGGYTVSDTSQTRFNTTSDYFFKIDAPSFIQYVQSGGSSPALNQVFPIVIQNDFVRVTGGELIVDGNNFYLVGGQDYKGKYSLGLSGKYTNAIRSFTLQRSPSGWSMASMNSLVDSVNLHRRDFNLVPYVTMDRSLDAIILGGVFTKENLSYNNPVYISGLKTGKPSITVGRSQQKCNQYSCAVIHMSVLPGTCMIYGLLGGISYMEYSSSTSGLVIGDNGVPMPFSNLIDFIISDGDSSAEYVQVPPRSLLPGYLGSNASFMPLAKYSSESYENIIDLNKVFADTLTNVNIGYMYGGIQSNGPTSGTTPKGHVNTYANPVLYSVNLTLKLDKAKINNEQ